MPLTPRENSLWKWLEAGKPDGCILERIENSVNDDTPDVLGSYQRVMFSIELKVASTVSNKDNKVTIKISSGQADRSRLWARSGTRTWILVQVPEVGRFLISGHYAKELQRKVSIEDLLHWSVTPKDAIQFQILRSASYR